ncbi:apelin receptor A-like [Dreissena polymorpha]|uniref:apelin receptor A-like n=1 Tax=Dreissena polymorpha TaxID=45954 RepID=UPI0022649D96|nr:apelin receptor A-like [Dreissena polymorpha]
MVVFYAYFFKWRRSTSRIVILFLVVLDMFNSATILPMEIFVMKNYLKLNSPFLYKIFRYGTYVMNCSSALILVGIALDRFQRICRPYKQTFSEWKSKCICIGAIVVALCVTWPSLVLYGTRGEKDKTNPVYVCKRLLNPNRIWSKLVFKLRYCRIGRSTMMLFGITIAYVLSFLPFYTLVIMRQINPMYFMNLPETSKSSYMAYLVFVRSYILSSAINPFMYSFCNIQFRNDCSRRLFSADNEPREIPD